MRNFDITVVGAGYVGMAMATLLSQKNNVLVLDIDAEKINKINQKKSTVSDPLIEDFLSKKKLSLKATDCKKEAFKNRDFIIVATPTDYDPINNRFDTSSVDLVLNDIFNIDKDPFVIIKSTLPIGHTKNLQQQFKTKSICFSPEFLREGRALQDNLHPSRIIIGSEEKQAKEFVNVLIDAAITDKIKTLYVSSSEAEAIKLFSNTYLAMRVSFFNELDSYSLINNLNSKNIIDGVCLDERIGGGYNNPSFGYGGYCLPKDTKQLLSNFQKIPQNIIEAVIKSNETRKHLILKVIKEKNADVIGFYKLSMKKDSDNFRSAAVIDLIENLKLTNKKILIYDPEISESSFSNCKVIKSIDEFKKSSDLVIANRKSTEIEDISEKVFTRDIFNSN